MNGTKNEDRRTRRTIAAIKKAFWQIADEKGFGNVTVTEIAERADINRKTFYHHFESIEVLQDELLLERISLMSDALRAGIIVKNGRLDVESLFQTLSEQLSISARRDGISLLQSNANRLISLMEPVLVRTMMENFPELFGELQEEKIHYAAIFFCSGLLTTYRRWLSDNSELDMNELAATLSACIAGGIPFLQKYAQLELPK